MIEKCVMCQAEDALEEYIGTDGRHWEPFYGDVANNIDIDGPVCPDCVKNHLEYSAEDEYFILK